MGAVRPILDAFAATVLAAGCLGRPSSHSGSGDAGPGDGLGDSAGRDLLCPSGRSVVYEDFAAEATGDPSCGVGHLVNGGAYPSSTNGNLVIESAGAATSAACVFSPFPSDGMPTIAAITRVPSMLAGGGDLTYMYLYSAGDYVQILASANGTSNDIRFYDRAAQPQGPLLPQTMNWWRVQILTPTIVQADVSMDGVNWIMLGQSPIAAGALTVQLGAFSGSGQQTPVAAFDFLGYCR